MQSFTITEGEWHPSGLASQREALGLTAEQLAAEAHVTIEAIATLEATPPGSGQYDSKVSISVQQALDRLKRK